MLPSATDLRYFLEVAQTLNLSRAARRLGVTQPALTQAMKKLEATVGLPLLIRTRTGVRLTRAGERVASRGAQLFVEWEAIEKAARDDTEEVRGRYRVGCHVAVGRYVLPRLFRELAAHAPGLEVQLTHDLSRKITEGVVDFRVDLGVVVNPEPHPDLVLKKLGTDVVTVFEADAGRYGDDLFGDPALLQTQQVVKKLDARALRVRRFVPCASLEVIHALTAAGAGYGVLPARVARCDAGLRLRPVAQPVPAVRDTICLVYRADVLVSRAGKALVRVASTVLAE